MTAPTEVGAVINIGRRFNKRGMTAPPLYALEPLSYQKYQNVLQSTQNGLHGYIMNVWVHHESDFPSHLPKLLTVNDMKWSHIIHDPYGSVKQSKPPKMA